MIVLPPVCTCRTQFMPFVITWMNGFLLKHLHLENREAICKFEKCFGQEVALNAQGVANLLQG